MNDLRIPAAVRGPHVWDRWTFQDPAQFRVQLSDATLREIADAVAALRPSGRKWNEITAEDMPLATFASQARGIRERVLSGEGFVVLAGLDASAYSKDEQKAAYWALGRHLGTLIPQTLRGDRMVTVADMGYDPDDANVRSSMTNRAIGFHTDTVIFGEIDIVCLLCLVQANRGGESRLVSAGTVYNVLAAEAPQCLEPLSHDFPIDRRSEFTGDMGPTANAPLLRRDGELVYSQCHHKLMITGARKINRVFSPQELAAVDQMNEVLGREDIVFEYKLQPGEMLFASNSLVLHDRARWVDDGDSSTKRHLERMWLSARPAAT